MTNRELASTIRLRRNTASGWAADNIYLAAGEPGYEKDTHRLKIGDGTTRWNDLEYFLPDDELRTLIEQVVSEYEDDPNSEAHLELMDHINSLSPHPVYDDGPSFLLLYQNAKV